MMLLLLYRTYDLCLIRSSFSLKGEDHHTADDLPAGRGPGVVAELYGAVPEDQGCSMAYPLVNVYITMKNHHF